MTTDPAETLTDGKAKAAGPRNANPQRAAARGSASAAAAMPVVAGRNPDTLAGVDDETAAPETDKAAQVRFGKALAAMPVSDTLRPVVLAIWQSAAAEPGGIRVTLPLFMERASRDLPAWTVQDLLRTASAVFGTSLDALGLVVKAAARTEDDATVLRYALEGFSRASDSALFARLALEAASACAEYDKVRRILARMDKALAGEAWALAAQFELGIADRLTGPADQAGARALLAIAQRLGEAMSGTPYAAAARIRALAAAGQLDAATRVLAGVPPLASRTPVMLRARAELAGEAGDADAAAAAWFKALSKGSNPPSVYLACVQALRKLQLFEQAGHSLNEGLARHPNSVRLLLAAERVAASAQRHADRMMFLRRAALAAPEDPALALSLIELEFEQARNKSTRLRHALAQLGLHHARYPDHFDAYVTHIRLLTEAGDLPAALEKTTAWYAQFPNNKKIALAHANVYGELGLTDQLIDTVSALRARVRNDPEVEAAFVRALSGSGHHADAERAAEAAVAAFPTSIHVHLERARVATRQGKWQQALDHLQHARTVLPNPRILVEIRNVRLMLGEGDNATDASNIHAALMERFESLGGTYTGCEFSVVQKQLGVDRVGLLRWVRISPEQLIAGLRARFDGVGEPQFTRLMTFRAGSDQEYHSVDSRFGMKAHTFVKVKDATPDMMLQSLARRQRFLRQKLLEDISGGERIMVYKAVDMPSPAVLAELAAALHDIGPAPLLVAVKAERAADAGRARLVAPGVAVGFVKYFMNAGNAGADIMGWRSMCQEAAEVLGALAKAA